MNIQSFLEFEKQSKIDGILIDGDIPLWRICRRSVRIKYLRIVNKTTKPEINYIHILFNIFISFFQLLYLILFVKKDYVFFPHSRLYKIDGQYIDKLSDPIIDSVSEIKKSFCILQNPQNGKQNYPRYHNKNAYNLDSVVAISTLFSAIFKKYYSKKYSAEILQVLNIIHPDNNEIAAYRDIIVRDVANFFITYKLYSIILHALSPKAIFVIPREVFSSAVVYCRRHGIKTMEIEHGITMTENELYSGLYNETYDVDYFLTFGQASNDTCFGMPLDKVRNIGFAYKHWLFERIPQNKKSSDKIILILSEPHITDRIVQTTIELALTYKDYFFCIRCHPQERLSKEHINTLSLYNNISIADNKQESLYSFYLYDAIIGENSSSVYEALSIGKRVGRLNYNGFKSININPIIYSGKVLNNIGDFMQLMTDDPVVTKTHTAYSDFNQELLLNLML